MKRLFICVAAVVMLMSLASCTTETNAVISTVIDGTPGFTKNEGCDKLFDYDVNTKWCVNPFEEAYVIWQTTEMIKPNGYIIVTANDNETYKGRNPSVWTLYGSYETSPPSRTSVSWEEIDSVANRTVLTDTNYTEHYFDVSGSPAYDYFMLEIKSVQSGSVMQISEFALQYKGGEYQFNNSAYGNTQPTDTNEDYDVDYDENYDDSTTTDNNLITTDPYIITTESTPDYTTTTKVPVANGDSYFPDLNAGRRFYGLLNANEKLIYDQICAAIESFTTEIKPVTDITTESLKRIHKCIRSDRPEYFWADRGLNWSYNESTDIVSSITLEYQYPKNVVPTMQLQIDKAVRKLCAGITADFSEYDIALYVYEQLINTIDYDTVGLQIQESDESLQGADDLRSIYGAFIDKRCVCVGYAYATQYILNKYGIECSTISNEIHSWNLVKLEGDYYYIDTTWGDPSNTDPLKESSDDISYAYFCMTTEQLNSLESHEIPSDINVPLCTATKCNYFVRSGLYFEAVDSERLQALFDKAFATGEREIYFRCSDTDCYNEIKKHLFEDKSAWDYINAACEAADCETPDTLYRTTYDSSLSVRITF